MADFKERRAGGTFGSLDPELDRAILVGAAVPLKRVFLLQSYFDSALLEQALLTQYAGEGIVGATLDTQQVAGVGFALHPSSQCPVAIQPTISGGGNSSIFTLKPGQVLFPGPSFEGFRWGLPNGWLGGGSAYLYILKERMSVVAATGEPEVLFHRARYKIYNVADNPNIGSRFNWPVRFPWSKAVSGFNALAVAQQASANIAVNPTKTIFRLRLSTVPPGGATLKMIWTGTDDFDLGSDGKTYDALGTSGGFTFLDFPGCSPSGFTIGGTAPIEFPVITRANDETTRIGGDQSLVAFIDVNAAGLGGFYLDVCRYGKIGG